MKEEDGVIVKRTIDSTGKWQPGQPNTSAKLTLGMNAVARLRWCLQKGPPQQKGEGIFFSLLAKFLSRKSMHIRLITRYKMENLPQNGQLNDATNGTFTTFPQKG